ncbi:MAG: 30S ribosome-binding factor RbfA [Clostridiales bacterium]|nr:30S ribosome-binding factor RbfA [Clostridiales bacterium]
MGRRILKVNAEIQKYVGMIIKDLNNPVIHNTIVCVNDVKTTEDLEISKIYISVFDKDLQDEVLNQVKHSANYIRKELAQRLDIRKVPYLEFYIDYSVEYGSKIDAVLDRINEERKDITDED